jgi:Sec-independent protein secretion pathway component TatC
MLSWITKTALWDNIRALGLKFLTIILCYVFSILITIEYIEEVIVLISKYFLQSSTSHYQIFFSYSSIVMGTNIIYDLANYVAILVTGPCAIKQFYNFARPGLYEEERVVLKKIGQNFFFFHFTFIFIFVTWLLPFILSNLNELNEEFNFDSIHITFEPDLVNYITLVKYLFIYNYVIFGLFFLVYLLPVVKILRIFNRFIFYLIVVIAGLSIIHYFNKYNLLIFFVELFINFCLMQELLNYISSTPTVKNKIIVGLEGVGFEPTFVFKQ